MKITKIEKKKRLYLLELDETEKLYVTEDTLVRFMLSKGMEISEEQLEEIRDFAQFSYGKNLALYHLSFKMRTVKEVQHYLIKYDIEEPIIERVLLHLQEEKWLDDRKYAEALINSNSLSGDKGAYALQQKLQQKGIAASLAKDCLAAEDFSEVASRVARKLLKRYEGKLPPKALQDKIIQNLSSKGFSYQEARNAFEDLEVEEDEETTMDLLYAELDKQYRKHSRKYEGYELKQRLTQSLARKGYDFSDIGSALRDFL